MAGLEYSNKFYNKNKHYKVRLYTKTDAISPYIYLGQSDIVSYSGNKRISIARKLIKLIDNKINNKIGIHKISVSQSYY